jgi:hypothetical protein
MSANVTIREYRDRAEFDREAKKLARDGWEVQTMTERSQRSGCVRILLTGGLALVFPPKPHLVVTYRRAGGDKVE